jgi:hypothetical protein
MNQFCAWMIIEWSLKKFVFFVMIWNPRWPPPQVIVLTQNHMGKYRNIFFSEAIALIEPKLYINHWRVLYKLCVFYVDRNSKMTTTAGHSFYLGPIGSFYNQVNDTGSWELWCIYVLPGGEYRMFFFYKLYWLLNFSPYFCQKSPKNS